ncbi:MAG: tRNA lysidine(34) synthetase TilS [Caulobacteraceae bacterium]|nr:tRNA lysidine(34) synthetase TilS [Caulobacteraceae bacterium]
MRLSAAEALLGHHLQPTGAAPIAVAYSGGGDSLALLLIADAWARRHGRRLAVLHVDHRLQGQSAAWAETCEGVARSLGRPFRRLAWLDAAPGAGLPARARAARHVLLAAAARDLGAKVVLMGHTADDLAESAAMRAAGSTTPDPRVFAPSPAWPEGRGVFLLRPLLTTRRQTLRGLLAAAGRDWIDDPANLDPRYARARARREQALALPAPAEPPALAAAKALELTCSGGLRLAAPIPADDLPRLLAIACVSAGGGSRPPRRAAVLRLAGAVAAGRPLTAALAGASVRSDGARVRVVRNVGEFARRGLAPLRLGAGEAGVWDGRFEIEAGAEVAVTPLSGLARRLSPEARRRLARVPAEDRPALPALVTPSGEVSCPLLGEAPGRVRPLALARARAATGLVEREPI